MMPGHRAVARVRRVGCNRVDRPCRIRWLGDHDSAGRSRAGAASRFHFIRKLHPGVLRLLQYGHRWRREVRISERSDRNDVCVRSGISFPIQGCSAVGAEIEANLPSRLSIPIEDLCIAFDCDLSLREASNAGMPAPQSAAGMPCSDIWRPTTVRQMLSHVESRSDIEQAVPSAFLRFSGSLHHLVSLRDRALRPLVA